MRSLTDLLESAEIRCPGCHSMDCAKLHGRWRRKKVTDLSTGEVVRDVPILRVRFCTGGTLSLLPGELWRGRYTIPSVLKTVVQILRHGVEAACEWASRAGDGEELVSPRTLQRWRGLVRHRLVGAALAWLLPRIGGSWSKSRPELPQLEALLSRITGSLLALFRTAFRRGVLDKAHHSRTRPVPARRDPSFSHDPSCGRKTRPAPCRPRSRRWPPGDT